MGLIIPCKNHGGAPLSMGVRGAPDKTSKGPIIRNNKCWTWCIENWCSANGSIGDCRAKKITMRPEKNEMRCHLEIGWLG